MKKATVRDLRYNFPKVAKWVEDGETVLLTRQGKALATMVAYGRKQKKKISKIDLSARLNQLFPGGAPQGAGAEELINQLRGDY